MLRCIDLIEASIEELKQVIARTPSREKSLVLTHLQEAYLWAKNEGDLVIGK
jgi:hypothetical protein